MRSPRRQDDTHTFSSYPESRLLMLCFVLNKDSVRPEPSLSKGLTTFRTEISLSWKRLCILFRLFLDKLPK